MNKKILFLLIGLFLISVLLILALFLGKPEQKHTAPQVSPGEAERFEKNNFPNAVESVGEDFSSPSTQTKEDIDRSYLVSQLIPKLPYRSNNFSLFYSFSDDKFTLYINSGNQNQGNADFDSFLKQNGVADRSWIDNLNTVVTSFTPGP